MIQILSLLPHQRAPAERMAAGLAKHGLAFEIVTQDARMHTDTVIVWGWRRAQRHIIAGRNVLIMERGYIGDRFVWTSLAWNGLNGHGTFPEMDDGGSRWRRHFEGMVKPWRKVADDDPIVLIGQVPGDASLIGRDYPQWLRRTAHQLQVHRRPVIYRPHPVALNLQRDEPPKGLPEHKGQLSDLLERTAWVVTLNSNTAVEAVLSGVPAVATDPGSMAWMVTGHDPADPPPRPHRFTWAHRLAWCQWRPEELMNGEAWEAVASCLAGRENVNAA